MGYVAAKKLRLLDQIPPDTAPRPTATSVSPAVDSAAGGAVVTIRGTGFWYPDSLLHTYYAYRVDFGGAQATSVSVVSATELTCVVPAHAAGTVEIRVWAPGGNNVLPNAFVYNGAPIVTSVSPAFGVQAGGTSVTIHGSAFTGAIAATIGGVPVTSLIVVNDTTITCVTGAHAAGTVNVVVTTGSGSGTGGALYEYLATPGVSAISPASGTQAGGTPVTITGTHFLHATSAAVGGVPVTSFVVVNDTTITGLTGAHGAATVDVTVTDAQGTGTLVGGYQYADPFNPATLPFTGWWVGDDYDGGHAAGSNVWTRKASAGTSGVGAGRDFTDASLTTNAPTAGALLNGHKTVAWSRAGTTGLVTVTAGPSFFSDREVWSMGVLVKVTNIVSNNSGANSYLNEMIFGDAGGFWGMMLRSAGALFQSLTYPTVTEAGITLGQYTFLQARGITGGTTQVRIDSGAWSTPAAHAFASNAQALECGFTSQGPSYMEGVTAEQFITDVTFSDGQFDDYKSYLNTQYGLAL